MALEQRQAWQELDASISPRLTDPWRAMSTQPYKRDGKWQSVFHIQDTGGEL
jgi:hypothetical protein